MGTARFFPRVNSAEYVFESENGLTGLYCSSFLILLLTLMGRFNKISGDGLRQEAGASSERLQSQVKTGKGV